MYAQQSSATARTADSQERLLRSLEAVLTEMRLWEAVRFQVRVQIMADFQMSGPSEEDARAALQDYGVFAMALRRIADRLDEEVEDMVNSYYDWLTD